MTSYRIRLRAAALAWALAGITALAACGDGTPDGATASAGESTSVPASSGEEVAQIPAGFPLAVGLPEGDGETEVSPPSADGDGVGEVKMCGRVVWPLAGPAGSSQRLATGALGPEYFDGRELYVAADADTASEAMTAIRRAARECRSSGEQVWTALDRDTGYDTVTMGLTYAQGPGSSVFQVTRVGAARLMVQTYGEGTLASLGDQADEVTATTSRIVPAMCVFTRTGC